MKKIIRWIIIVTILIVVILLVVRLVQDSNIGTNASENQLIAAAKKYYNEKPHLLPSANYGMERLTSDVLIERGYLKQTTDQYGAPKSCSSYITVTNVNNEYFYNPYVDCGIKNDTLLLYDHLVSLAKEETKDGTNGLFIFGNKYVFRGDKPNKYIEFAGKNRRIIQIEEDKSIKLMYNGNQAVSRVWDDRFNLEKNKILGVNKYEISRIKDYVTTYYNKSDNFSNKSKSKLTFINLCIGERDIEDKTTDGSAECQKIFDNQFIGLPSVNEYLNASNDPNCPTTMMSCKNYNFMAAFKSYWSITPVKGTTHKVFRIYPNEGLISRDAIGKHYAHFVVSLKSDVAILSGDGSKSNPYVLK